MARSDSFPTVGILGAGQLGRMTAYSALQMGMSVRLLTPHETGAMKGVGEAVVGDWTDSDVLRAFAEPCDIVTVENEWAPVDSLAAVLPEETNLWPSVQTMDYIRHKGVQNDTLDAHNLPLPAYRRCATLEEAQEAAAVLGGYPVMMKRYRRSYDGYGNATVHTDNEMKDAWEELAEDDGILIEELIDFKQELSALVARRPGGEHVVYPVAYTVQRDHRCHAVVVPADLPDEVAQTAREVAVEAVKAVGGVGLTAVELFQDQDDTIYINELAPRPHNTGHYSIEGSYTPQFENHLRGVLDLPLGDPGLREKVAVMVNVLGHRKGPPRPKGLEEALRVPGAAVHIYGKTPVRPNRKMGHVTVTGNEVNDVRARAERAAAAIEL